MPGRITLDARGSFFTEHSRRHPDIPHKGKDRNDNATGGCPFVVHDMLFATRKPAAAENFLREAKAKIVMGVIDAALAGEDFTVLALSQDRDGWAVITPFLAKKSLGDLPFFHDRGSAFARDTKVLALPSTVLYGRDGVAIGRLTGHAEWDSDEAIAVLRHAIGR